MTRCPESCFKTLCLIAVSISACFQWPLAAGASLEELSLNEVWERAGALEPGFRAQQELDAGVEAEWQALRRQRYPSLSIAATADHGQRVRPGEERDQGISSRGEVLARGSWVFAESGRASREAVVAQRREVLQRDAQVFDTEFRAELARIYVEASLTEARFDHAQDLLKRLRSQEAHVRARVAAGVEPQESSYTVELLLREQEAIANEIASERALMRRELSAFVGAPIRPSALVLSTEPAGEPDSQGQSPQVTWLRAEAEERLLQAASLRDQDRWSIELFGVGGPYFSRAFENRSAKSEFYVGLGASWNPDFAGVSRYEALAEQRRARADLARADSESRRMDRLRERLQGHLLQLAEREGRLAEQQGQMMRQLAVEELRWKEGVGSWQALLDAHRASYDLELDRIDLQQQRALVRIQLAETAGALDALPEWLGQE